MAYFENPYRFGIETPMDDPGPWIAIDTETGGLDPEKHALLSMAWITSDGERDAFLLADCPGVWSREAQAVNGITRREVKEQGIPISEARQRFEAAIKGRAIVGQNVAFDLSFIASRLFDLPPNSAKLKKLFGSIPIHDTWKLFREMHDEDDWPSAKLAAIADFYEIEYEADELHGAAADVELTAKIFEAELEDLRGESEIADRRLAEQAEAEQQAEIERQKEIARQHAREYTPVETENDDRTGKIILLVLLLVLLVAAIAGVTLGKH